jgi:hypothetical protein
LLQKGHEAVQQAGGHPEPDAQALAHAEILVQRGGERPHGAPPVSGQGWTTARKLAMSTLA